MKRSTTSLALTLAVASVAIGGSLAGPVATASAATSIDMLNSLTFPHQTAGSICSAERRLRLTGTYDFAVYSTHRLHPGQGATSTRRLRLFGVYAWKVCLHRNIRANYQVEAGIRNVNSGGVASIADTISGRPWGNGYYDWGSTIDNVLG
jgi:hypothetical protein